MCTLFFQKNRKQLFSFAPNKLVFEDIHLLLTKIQPTYAGTSFNPQNFTALSILL